MTRLVEMKIHAESSPNHGKHVVVDLDGPQYNPLTDEMDKGFATAWVLESRQKGSIALSDLIFPLPQTKQWDGVPFE